MFEKEKYGRILVPMVTPFKEDQSVDYEKAKRLAGFLAESDGCDTIILSGSTGEGYLMSFDERAKLFETVKQHVGNAAPVIAGVGFASTKETIALAKEAEKIGIDLAMVVAPYYGKPNQEEIYTHFSKVAESVSIDILLYNIPIYTGVNIEPETLARLAKIKNIVGIKEEAEINPKQITAFLNATPDDFIIYNGDDTMILEAFAQGGSERVRGVVSGTSHFAGKMIREMIESFLDGDIERAGAIQRKLHPLFMFGAKLGRSNDVPILKAAITRLCVDAGLPRLPLLPATPEETRQTEQLLHSIGLM